MAEKSEYTVVRATDSARGRREFIDFPKRLYRKNPYWVPMFDIDMRLLVSRKHPFFLHSPGDFFLLKRDGETVGRSMVAHNTRYNAHHGTNFAFFDLFDCIDDTRAAEALFDHLSVWARSRGLEKLTGPMLSGGTYGVGILVEGFEHPPAMTMMRYNFPYYRQLLEKCGFEKYVDMKSLTIPPDALDLPDRINGLADRALDRGRFRILDLKSKHHIKRIAGDVKKLYGGTLTHHLEDYPLTPEELDLVEKDLLTIADPELITILTYDEKIVGYAFGFADVSATLRKNRGKVGPIRILRLLRSMKRSSKILFNGLGILPEYQKLGGNALMYQRMAGIVARRGFTKVEMVQISEHTELMLKDAGSLGGMPVKIHRMYSKRLD